MDAIDPMDRRKFVRAGLGAVALAGAACVAPAVAMGAAPASDRAEWQGALDRVTKTREAVDASVDVMDAAQTGYFAARPQRDMPGFLPSETLATCLARAAREKEETAQIDQELRERFGVDLAEQGNEDATAEFSAALDDLMECPAPDGAAVIHKITLAREFDLNLDQALVDLHRLFGITAA